MMTNQTSAVQSASRKPIHAPSRNAHVKPQPGGLSMAVQTPQITAQASTNATTGIK